MNRKPAAKKRAPLRINISEAGRDVMASGVYSVEVWPLCCDQCGAIILSPVREEPLNCSVCLEDDCVRAIARKQQVAVVLQPPFPKRMQAKPVVGI